MSSVEAISNVNKTDITENIYDTLEIEDLDFEEDSMSFYYPCPCGDRFKITLVILTLF